MIPRLLEKELLFALNTQKKLLILYGPRQAGKTTVLTRLSEQIGKSRRTLYLNCDLAEDLGSINTTALTALSALARTTDILLIDEAQRLDNPGLTLKILHDHFPNLRIVATESSSFHLKNELSDALTGRYRDFTLYPLALEEILTTHPVSDNPAVRTEQLQTMTEPLLLYGLYPEIYTQALPSQKQGLLATITESYLFRDVLSFHRVRRSQTIVQLAQALAYQIGNELNENELATRLKIDRKTVVKYLDILEQSFVIIRVYPFSRNPRREIGRNYKAYFVDVGIRNALIGDFNSLAVRSDRGVLWENFLIVERIKRAANHLYPLQYYFWRSYAGAEVDWIEKRTNDPMQAFEIKYTQQTASRGAGVFSKEYQVPVQVIHRGNYGEYIL